MAEPNQRAAAGPTDPGDPADPAGGADVGTRIEAADVSGGGPATGHPQVDAALTGLAEVSRRPPAEQIGAYEAADEALRATLSSIEES
jgi:hypothetical protein